MPKLGGPPGRSDYVVRGPWSFVPRGAVARRDLAGSPRELRLYRWARTSVSANITTKDQGPRTKDKVMGEVRPHSATIRDGMIPHRWARVEDPGSVAVVAAYEAIIAGGGPAGLTAAYELSKHGKPCVVLEADPR